MQSNKLDRAKQFMPFAALRGYYELIKQCEKIKEPKKELSEEEGELLSSKINTVKKNMLVKVTYYNDDSYKTLTGIVSDINTVIKTITIIKTKINFDDILDIVIQK